MEEYASFPTMIYKFNTNIDKKDNVKMASYIKDNDEMQTEDKLYLNIGGLEFKDITKQALINNSNMNMKN